jgi:hypothetical protein
MKTMILILILGSLMTFNVSYADKNPVQFILEDEAYIDDIPFNTAEIAKDVLLKHDLKEFKLKDEAYIDDIPFSTEQVYKEASLHNNLVKCNDSGYKCGQSLRR